MTIGEGGSDVCTHQEIWQVPVRPGRSQRTNQWPGTDTDLSAEDVALRYKDLLQVENAFRTAKSILETRPIFHKCDDTIRGHVFCSFLALVLMKELQDRMASRGWRAEWARLRDDLDELQELTLPLADKTFVIRTPPVGEAVHAIQAVGVALGSSVRLLD